MKFTILAIGCAVATVQALPAVDYRTTTAIPGNIDAKIDKLNVGGLSTPSAMTASLNTKAAPVNYGNMNMGTGLMPSQVVHYGTENQPDRAAISPVLVSTTGKDVDYQISKGERVRNLINADMDFGHVGRSKYADEDDYEDYDEPESDLNLYGEDEDENAKYWGWGGHRGWWGGRRGWGWGGRGWGWGGRRGWWGGRRGWWGGRRW